MKNFLFGFSIVALVMSTLVITSCNSEDGISPKGPGQEQSSLDWRAGNPTVSGHVELDFTDLAIFEKYSFNAVMHQDGSVSGEFNVYDNYDGPDRIVVHGNVTCFSIQPDGKTAWLGGTVTNGDFVFDGVEYDYTGSDANWTVVDNGSGNNAPQDQATDLTFGWDAGSVADYYCGTGDLNYNNIFGPIIRGNVNVKP